MRFVGLDPSTKTGFVALDLDGNVLREKELTGVGDLDPKRMVTLIDEVIVHLRPEDIICIEGFGFKSQQAIQLGGIGWGIRMALFRRGIAWYDVAPNAVKKFVGVTGWIGEEGKKKRLTGPEKKKAVMAAVKDHFGFTHKNDNVVDAYILAQVAMAIHYNKTGEIIFSPDYQLEVVQKVLGSAPKKKVKA